MLAPNDIKESENKRFREVDEEQAGEVCQDFGGWTLSMKANTPMAPIKNYCNLMDVDYNRHRVTVCAHLLNIFNTYTVQNDRPLQNFFDIDKWTEKHEKTPRKQN